MMNVVYNPVQFKVIFSPGTALVLLDLFRRNQDLGRDPCRVLERYPVG